MNPTPKNGESPLVSVCIPCWNAAGFIGETIRSVLESTWTNLEIIVSDDASTDATPEIVEGFDDGRIRLFRHETNLGAPGNWNRAIKHARGAYIGLLNHDDLYGPFWLSFAMHNLMKHPGAGWVTSAYRAIDRTGRPLGAFYRLPETREYDRDETFRCVAKMGSIMPVFIARREALEDAGPYDETEGPYADYGLHLRLAARWPMIYSANPLLAAKRRHPDNLMHRVWKSEKGERALQCLEILDKVCHSVPLSEELRGSAAHCRAYFHGIILDRCKTLLEKGNVETVHSLIRRTPTTRRDAFSPDVRQSKTGSPR